MRRLYERSPSSRGVAVDINGATLGPDCVLVRRTPEGYRCLSQDEAATIQALVIDREDDPDWLFRQCHRIIKALADQNLTLAQIFGLSIPVIELGVEQLQKLVNAARLIKANFNPIQPRDAQGRWTDESDTEGRLPSAAPRETRSQSAHPVITTSSVDTVPVQLAADNQRENKMVRDIVVQLRLTKDQRQELHRAISGEGLTYRQILDLAKEMFDK